MVNLKIYLPHPQMLHLIFNEDTLVFISRNLTLYWYKEQKQMWKWRGIGKKFQQQDILMIKDSLSECVCI